MNEVNLILIEFNNLMKIYFRAYKYHCLYNIAKFHMGELNNQEKKKDQLIRIENLIKCVLILYTDKHELKADFCFHLQNHMHHNFDELEYQEITKKANHYLEIMKLNELIIEKLFKLKDWCSVLSEIMLKHVLLPMVSILEEGSIDWFRPVVL